MKLCEKVKKLNIDVEKDVKYFYFRPQKGEFDGIDGGSITVAYCQKTGFTGVAYQSPKDQFVKKIGRNIALGRLIDKASNINMGPDINLMEGDKVRTEHIKNYVMGLICSENVPIFLRHKK